MEGIGGSAPVRYGELPRSIFVKVKQGGKRFPCPLAPNGRRGYFFFFLVGLVEFFEVAGLDFFEDLSFLVDLGFLLSADFAVAFLAGFLDFDGFDFSSLDFFFEPALDFFALVFFLVDLSGFVPSSAPGVAGLKDDASIGLASAFAASGAGDAFARSRASAIRTGARRAPIRGTCMSCAGVADATSSALSNPCSLNSAASVGPTPGISVSAVMAVSFFKSSGRAMRPS